MNDSLPINQLNVKIYELSRITILIDKVKVRLLYTPENNTFRA